MIASEELVARRTRMVETVIVIVTKAATAIGIVTGIAGAQGRSVNARRS